MQGLAGSRSLRVALLQHARVILALMLRDIQTRFGATYLGFLFGLILPLGHIGIVLGIYILMGRRAPIGTDVTLFLASAIVPFVVWSYTHQRLIQSFSQNWALTAFPIVKFDDILAARCIVELLNAVLVVAIVAAAFAVLGNDLFIADPMSLFYCLFLSYALGVATGFVFGLLGMLAPIMMMVGYLTIPIYWLSSGVFFIPEALPEQARAALAVIPLWHIVDFGRSAFFPSYLSSFPSLFYVHAVIVANILFGFALQRFLRSSFRS